MNDKILFGAMLSIAGALYAGYSFFSTIGHGSLVIRFGPLFAGLAILVRAYAHEKQSWEHDEVVKRTSLGQATKEDWNKDGNEFFALENYDEAIKSYNKALELDPEYASAWVNKGSALYKLGLYQDAIADYDKAIQIDPESALAWNHKGLALKKLGQSSEASNAFAKAKELGFKV
ncbi:MAG: tetratricopeptide repeat protein [Syntrophales bacterium]